MEEGILGPHSAPLPTGLLPPRTVYEDSGPGRPLSCFMEEPAPYTDGPAAAAGGGNCRFVESPGQDQRLQAQRLRNPEVRGSLQTPQNRPHGHQSPELPEGYGERTPSACSQNVCLTKGGSAYTSAAEVGVVAAGSRW